MSKHTMRPAHALLAIAALTSMSACSVFKVKPASTTPAPTQPANRPATQPATTPANQPATRPAGAQPTTPTSTPTTRPTTPPTTQPAPTTQGAAQGTPPRTAGAPTTPATTPAATPPAAPRLTQDQIEANRIKEDSTRLAGLGRTRRYSPVYFTMMFDLHGARLHTQTSGVVAPEEEPGIASFELALQKANGGGLGIAVRSIGSADAYEYAEAALLMGSRRFALDLGAATRTGYDSLGLAGGGAYDTTFVFARAGFRSRANLGQSDFSVQLRALVYAGLPPLDDALPDAKLEGYSFETGLSWTWSKFPLTANLGYRIERFRVFSREQETSSLVLGGGLLIGRRPRPAPVAPAESVSPPANAQTPPAGRP